MSNNINSNKAVITVVDFMRWWRDELLGLLPDGLCRLICLPEEALNIQLRAGQIETLSVPSEKTRVRSADVDLLNYLASLEQPLAPVVVSVAEEDVLCRQLEFPAAVMENLSDVLTFEMDRQTPFRADQVFFAYQVLQRSTDNRQVTVELCVVPREKVLSGLSPMEKWSLQADQVSIAGEQLHIRFVSQAWRENKSAKAQYLPLTLSMMLIAALFIVPLWQQQETLQDLQAELATVRKATLDAQSTRQKLEQHIGTVNLLTQHKSQTPPVIDILEQLSQLLPDTTWVKQLEIKNGVVHLHGVSAAASSLIGILEGSELFSNARFSSPTTQDKQSSGEKFRIKVDLAGQKASS